MLNVNCNQKQFKNIKTENNPKRKRKKSLHKRLRVAREVGSEEGQDSKAAEARTIHCLKKGDTVKEWNAAN